jgi:hypothetical protein
MWTANAALDTARNLISLCAGVAFGRFDVRVVQGKRTVARGVDPFARLPRYPPGMLIDDHDAPYLAPPVGYPIDFPQDGILVDDPGADRDLVGGIQRVFDVVFGDAGEARLREVAEILAPNTDDLRRWLRSNFFEEHIQRYSKSRRKAPIYWRLGTPSGTYSVWLYLHRSGPDTLHAILRDHVEPKLQFETNRLGALQAEAGDYPGPSQRRAIDAHQAFVEELSTFRDELRRAMPLWKPNLDDGVVVNACYLHRLFGHTRSWQKECQERWNALQVGEYDWTHLAMRLWPERVVQRCADDRSLALAHRLETTFWFVDKDGKWHPRPVDASVVAQLTRDRTSSAVKDSLMQLSAVPTPGRPSRSPARGGAPKPVRARVSPAERTTQLALDLSSAETGADQSVVDALRAAVSAFPDGAGKAELLGATGIHEAAWKTAIDALVASGEVERTGQKRGTRYQLRAGGRR